MRTKTCTLGSHSTRGISLHEDTSELTLKRAMQEITMRGSEKRGFLSNHAKKHNNKVSTG